MPTVYRSRVRRTGVRFHKTPDCVHLIRKPSRGNRQPVDALDLTEVEKPIPCEVCYPDAPKAVSAHQFCGICNTTRTRPCAHNGGIKVYLTRYRRKPSLRMNPGEEQSSYIKWVWPEHAHLYL
jgi:hypothetical protein